MDHPFCAQSAFCSTTDEFTLCSVMAEVPLTWILLDNKAVVLCSTFEAYLAESLRSAELMGLLCC